MGRPVSVLVEILPVNQRAGTVEPQSLPDQTLEFDGENQQGWELCPWLHPLKTTPVRFDFPATALVDAHYDIRTIQQLLGHKDVQTTMICTHVLNKGGRGVQSPADRL